jgi:two-component system NtrC family response regulator
MNLADDFLMPRTTSPQLLIVEDDLALQRQIQWSLDGFESVCADSRELALVQLNRHLPPVVTMDLGLPPDADGSQEGFALLEQMLQADPHVKVIVLTGQSQHEHALKAVAMGAYDFMPKPFEPELLELVVKRALRLHELQAENRRLQAQGPPQALSGLITRDPEMLRLTRLVERVAPSDATVLLLGESGTGKEVLAKGLHEASGRCGRFVAINCAAIPENLLESELFGYERGAFTGAAKSTPGRIETAHGGTLMLDEIGDLPLSLQAKLLRFLQERQVERLGARSPISVDVRVVGATHQDLRALIGQGRFREDLYYRLAEVELRVPPLRARVGDAVLLANAFLKRFSQDHRNAPNRLDTDAVRAIEAHAWPGNVRELLNVIKRGAIMGDGPSLGAVDIGLAVPSSRAVVGDCAPPEPASEEATDTQSAGAAASLNLRQAREMAERRVVVTALARTDSNLQRAADLLGVSRPTLYDLMDKLGLR